MVLKIFTSLSKASSPSSLKTIICGQIFSKKLEFLQWLSLALSKVSSVSQILVVLSQKLACESLIATWFSRHLTWHLFHLSGYSVKEDFFWISFGLVKSPSVRSLRLAFSVECSIFSLSESILDKPIWFSPSAFRWHYLLRLVMSSFMFDVIARQEHLFRSILPVSLIHSADLEVAWVHPRVQEWNPSCCRTPDISFAILLEYVVSTKF